MAEVAPVAEQARIKSLDVMRGLAVLGILAVNAAFFAAPWQASQNPMLAPLAVSETTLWSWLAMHVFFEFKFITLFSLLFGASLYLVGGEVDDEARSAVLRRRLFWLLVFGVIHGALIWYGDVLVPYAFTGFLVMALRSRPPRDLLYIGAALLIVSLALQSWFGIVYDGVSAGDLTDIREWAWAPPPAELARVQAAFRGDIVTVARENAETWWDFISTGLFSLAIRTAGVMLVGMALLKLGFLSGDAPRWTYWLAVAIGAAALVLVAWQAWINWEARFDFERMHKGGQFANNALSIFVSIGYAALCVLLVKAGVRSVTEPLAAVGRMAFSNYIAQSLIMTTIFWGGRGFGLIGAVDRPTLMALVPVIWSLQLICSSLWLSQFRMGPLEWVWRRLSYGKPLAMGKREPARDAGGGGGNP
jgi:uncharacterized protein